MYITVDSFCIDGMLLNITITYSFILIGHSFSWLSCSQFTLLSHDCHVIVTWLLFFASLYSHVMTFFDRKVDLAQFASDHPLYIMCRAWMRNDPYGGSEEPTQPVSPQVRM